MKSVKSLRSVGFTVRSATDAVDCTEVSSDKLFYYYNPKFAKDPLGVHSALQLAGREGERYRLLIAGACPADDGEVPFVIVNEQQRQQVAVFYEQHKEAAQVARVAEQQFYDSVRTIMCH